MKGKLVSNVQKWMKYSFLSVFITSMISYMTMRKKRWKMWSPEIFMKENSRFWMFQMKNVQDYMRFEIKNEWYKIKFKGYQMIESYNKELRKKIKTWL